MQEENGKPVTVLPVGPGAGPMVVFGGSFDPPHAGHFGFVRFVLEAVAGSRVLMVPAARSPHKGATGASGPERAAMLRAGLAEAGLNDRAAVWTDEIDRAAGSDEPSFFVETLRRLRRVLPAGVSVRFVIGSDQVEAFRRWREPAEILRLATPIVLRRGDGAVAEGFARFVLAGQPMSDASSTRARELLARGAGDEELGELLPAGVLAMARRVYGRAD